MPITYHNHLQESAALMSLTFLAALWALRERNDLLFLIILILGGINNETTLFLPSIYFFINYKKSNFTTLCKLGLRTLLMALPAFIIVGIIRYINIDRPHLGGAFHLYENMLHLYRPLLTLNVFWFLAFLFFKNKPLFLQRSLLTVPLFIIPHLITGVITETRQMLPLAMIIIPASMFSLIELQKIFNIPIKKGFLSLNHQFTDA